MKQALFRPATQARLYTLGIKKKKKILHVRDPRMSYTLSCEEGTSNTAEIVVYSIYCVGWGGGCRCEGKTEGQHTKM